MNRIGFALLATALLVSSGLAAKDKDDKQHLDPYVTGPANEARTVQEIRHQLVMLPYYSVFDDLAFNVNGGTVTLLGEVTKPVLKEDAGKVVQKVEGVTNVINNIEVLPLSGDRRSTAPAHFSGDLRRPRAVNALRVSVAAFDSYHRQERECAARRRGR